MRWQAFVAVLLVAMGCSARRPARLDSLAEPLPDERDAAERVEASRCAPVVDWLWPGAGQACHGRTAEGAFLASLAAAEMGAGVALLATAPEEPEVTDAFSTGGRLLPLVGWQNLYVGSLSLAALDRRRARKLPFVPRDTLPELAAAPFDPAVLKRPSVWGPTVALTAGATGLILLTEAAGPGPSARPVLFGRDMDPALGWPAATALGVATFEHVAIGEELAFRGLVQSDLARRYGETEGWVLGSLVFGLTHATNALLLPPEDRRDYLLISLPWITATGSVLGLVYRHERYSLSAPVAIHFWYDLLITGVMMLRDPSQSMFATVQLPLGGRRR